MKFLVADDHPIFRRGLCDILAGRYAHAEFIECETGQEALHILRKEKPEIAVLDIDMPLLNGLEVCQTAYRENLPSKIIILTMHKDAEMFNKAFLSGALGYVVKDNSVRNLLDCVAQVLLNKKYIDPVLQDFAAQYTETDKRKAELRALLQSLTQSELKTLRLVASNHSCREIAELLFVSVKTAENYRSRVCKKLQLDPRNNSLLHWVMEHRDLLRTIREF